MTEATRRFVPQLRRLQGNAALKMSVFLGLVMGAALTIAALAPEKTLVLAAAVFLLVGMALLVVLTAGMTRRALSLESSAPRGPSAPLIWFMTMVFLLSATLISVDRLAPDSLESSQGRELVYRVFGGKAARGGQSWTPIDPRLIGPQQFRMIGGLPDKDNSGDQLVYGYVDARSSIRTIRPALPIAQGDHAFCTYPGGLLEYVIPDASIHVVDVHLEDLDGHYGGDPGTCATKSGAT